MTSLIVRLRPSLPVRTLASKEAVIASPSSAHAPVDSCPRLESVTAYAFLAGVPYDDLMRARAALGIVTLTWAAAAACDDSLSPTVTTGLTGVVVRGPITPVCQIQIACDSPFSADFSIEQNSRSIQRFRSDANGHFTVMLIPGAYRIVPDADAPILSPRSQAKMVEVLPLGLTQVRLEFDTGIR